MKNNYILIDAGFDPLIGHLKDRKILAQRERDLGEIPLVRISNATSVDDKVGAIVNNLAARGHAPPRKRKTLENTINAMFMKTLEEAELQAIIAKMERWSVIAVENEKVSYNPPIVSP